MWSSSSQLPSMLFLQYLMQQSIQVWDPPFSQDMIAQPRQNVVGSMRLVVCMMDLNMHDRGWGRESWSRCFLEPADTVVLLTDNCCCQRRLHLVSIFFVIKMHSLLRRFFIFTRQRWAILGIELQALKRSPVRMKNPCHPVHMDTLPKSWTLNVVFSSQTVNSKRF